MLRSALLLSGVLYMLTSTAQEITFSEHIAPIVHTHCTPCHQEGEIAPMSLVTYEETRAYAAMIKYVTGIRYMPPWKAAQTAIHFEGERVLTDQEILLIRQWVDSGMPSGDTTHLPKRPEARKKEQMADPDTRFAMTEAFEQYGVYYDQYRVFVLETDLEKDEMISSIEFVPGNREIVRSCIISVDLSDQVESEDAWDPAYGYFSFGELGIVPAEGRWYCWHPGQTMTTFPDGKGLFLPRGAKLLFHIHYGPTGTPQKDSSYVNLKFAEKTITPIRTAPLFHPYNLSVDSFYIAAEKVTRYQASFTLPVSIELYGLFPQAHLLGRSWEIFAVHPEDQTSKILLKVDDWDFNWKQMYRFEKPLALKKGTVVYAIAIYDNTSDNLLNPSDPARPMGWGKRMFEELFLTYFQFSLLEKTKNRVSILPGAVNVCEEEFEMRFEVEGKEVLSLSVRDFKGKQQRVYFKEKKWGQGLHHIKLSLAGLPKGNYVFQLENDDGLKAEYIIVYLEPDVFD